MAVRTVSASLNAQGLLNLEPANYLFVYAASAAISIQFQGGAKGGSNEFLAGVGAGVRVQRLQGWQTCNITGTPGTTVTCFYGFEQPREDSTDFVQTIATIAGTVAVTPGLGSANGPTDHADVSVASATTDTSIGANAARKSITIGSLSTNTPTSVPPISLRVRGHGNVVGGFELQPGTSVNIATTAALDIFNGDASAQKYWWQEYT